MMYTIGKFVWGTLGILSWLVAVLGGLYVGIWLMFIGGIVQIVEACKADPVEGLGIGIGAFRFVAAAAVGGFSFWFGMCVGGLCFAAATHCAGRQRGYEYDRLKKQL